MFVRNQNQHIVSFVPGSAQVMRNQKNPAAEVVADLSNETMEQVRPSDIDALVRLVEDKQVRTVNKRPG